MKNRLFLCVLLGVFSVQAQVPKYGNDTLLDVACWNLKWLGDTQNGPTDENLQYTNVQQVLNQTDIDIWGLCEVSNPTVWTNLLTSMPQYNGVISTFSQTQKTALLWKKNKFNLLSQQSVLTETQYQSDFASRPPLEVVLISKNTTVTDTLYLYVIHLKAFADAESYDRRKNASGHLKLFLDTYRKNRKVLVIGDWNDDLDAPIWSGAPASPFINLLQDTSQYFYPTKLLSDLGKRSYIFTNGSMIDHILMNAPLFPFEVNASAKVLDQLPAFISGFSSNTSDHYPVLSFLNLKRYPTVGIDPLVLQPELVVYPQPVKRNVTIQSDWPVKHVAIYDIMGKQVHAIVSSDVSRNLILELNAEIQAGCYVLQLEFENGRRYTQRLIVGATD